VGIKQGGSSVRGCPPVIANEVKQSKGGTRGILSTSPPSLLLKKERRDFARKFVIKNITIKTIRISQNLPTSPFSGQSK